MKKVVLYIGNFFYPCGNAAGKRVFGNIKALQKAGYETACLSFSKTTAKIEERSFDGTHVFEIPYRTGLRRMCNYAPYHAFLLILDELKKQYQIHAVVMYGSLGNSGFNIMVIQYCKKNGIKVVFDLVDWFDQPSKNNFLRYLAKKRDLIRLEKRVIPACDAWIVISTFLKAIIPDQNRAIVIPPLAAEIPSTLTYCDNEITTFAYASFVTDKNRPVSEWKDRIDTILDVFYDIATIFNRKDFFVKFIGFEKEALLDMFTCELRGNYEHKLEILSDNIIFLGPRKNEDVTEEIRSSDFTILIRDSKISTNAGFATKISESVSLGVPVLVNDTSDVSLYIKNDVNGYILPPPTDLEGIENVLLRCMDMSFEEKSNLKNTTFECKTFYFESYADQIATLLG